MEVKYRQSFLRDMKKLKDTSIYDQVFIMAFTLLPQANSLKEISELKPMVGYHNRYRIRIGNYRIGVEQRDNIIEMMRVLHRKDFYRYFP